MAKGVKSSKPCPFEDIFNRMPRTLCCQFMYQFWRS